MRAAAETARYNRAITAAAYAGDLPLAAHLFSQIPCPDLISWNALLSAHSRHSRHLDTLSLFHRMRHVTPSLSPTTLSVALSSARHVSLHVGRQLHALALKTPFTFSPFVATSLVSLYSHCHVIADSLKAFAELDNKTLPSWNSLLSGFLSNGHISEARRLFEKMPVKNVVTWTTMIGGLLQGGYYEEALELFVAAPTKNSVTWSMILRGLTFTNRCQEAVGLFLKTDWIRVGTGVVAVAVTACAELDDGGRCGTAVHGRVIKTGTETDPPVQAALISFYLKQWPGKNLIFFGRGSVEVCNSFIGGYIDGGRVDEAFAIFDGMKERDGASWILMIRGFLIENSIDHAVGLFFAMADPSIEACTLLVPALIKNGRTAEAVDLYNRFEPDVVLSTAMISALMSDGLVEQAMEIFNKTPDPNSVTVNIVLSGLIKHERMDGAREFFTTAKIKDEQTWSCLIAGLAKHGFYNEAFRLLKEMMETSNLGNPKESAIVGLLAASGNLSAVTAGEQIHGFVTKLGLDQRITMSNTLIAMYSKCGEPDRARCTFKTAPTRDLISWNAMINGYAVNGQGEEAVDLMEKMKESGTKPDEVTYLAVLSACVHGLRLGCAKRYLAVMESQDGIKPSLPHYSCLVELLCRLGRGDEAVSLVSSMPCEPDAGIWSSLLSGFGNNLRLDLAEAAAGQIIKIEPRGRAPYLTLARNYAENGRVGELQRLRKKMIARPGRSWIEIDGETVSFFAGSPWLGIKSSKSLHVLQEGHVGVVHSRSLGG